MAGEQSAGVGMFRYVQHGAHRALFGGLSRVDHAEIVA
jgi:hypothetical protein